MNHFFIAALPRSRTAWFANYLTFGSSFCFHDPFLGLDDPSQFQHKIRWISGASGASDPSVTLFWEQIHQWFPKAAWVVIERDVEDVRRSCSRILEIDNEKLDRFADELGRLKEALNPMVIQFDSINPRIAMEVAEHCGVYAGGMRRAVQLCKMNIQLDPCILREQLMELHAI